MTEVNSEHPSGGKRSAAESFGYTKFGSMFGVFSIRNPLKLVINCLVLLNFLQIINSSKEPDTEGGALRDLLLALNDSNGHIDWDPNLVSPCFSWTHVYCKNGHVVFLSLNSLGLSGTLSPAITKLKFLVSLELRNNNLSGSLPDYLGSMVQLKNLNLASNKFSGSIPDTWGQLSNLKILDVSSNNLTGRIPEKLFSVATFNFTGTNIACGLSFEEPCLSRSPLPVATRKSRLKVIAVSASCGAFGLLTLLVVLAYRYHQLHKEKNDIFVDVSGEDDRKISFGQLRRFSWRELQLATDNFSESNIIGQGGFGKVYKGILSDNMKVAVKRLEDYYSPGGKAAFLIEVQLISVAAHKNLLRLTGFCTTSSERILVYPYMQNLSVAYHLRDLKPGEKGLDWPTRKRIALRKSRLKVIAVSASCGAFGLLTLLVVLAYRYHQLHKEKNDIFVDVSGEDDRKISFGQLRRFSWRELQLATDNFSESNIIGQGGFGKVYKGILSDNMKVAVKRLEDYYSPGGKAAFLIEVQLISVAAHKNLLRLTGFCTTSSERILVYPYMQNLSVAYHLRDLKPGEKGLDWPTRKRIAFGAAHGLEYLHEHCNPKIIHRDLKAANILLDDSFEPVLGDFGLAKLVDTKFTHITTQVRGTMGHIAPEYLSTGKPSEKIDVFGYGITLLELVTGQRAIDLSRLEEEEDVLLLDHIKKLLRENRLDDVVDGNLETYDRKEVETIVQVALLCTQSSPEGRPTMAGVVKMLQGIGLAERWAKREQHENARNQEFSRMSQQYIWSEDSSIDQEAIQLSKAR
ncbi:hypothetical protein NC652_003175 [Populus alba x Populus x berolinensis]|nr:hypothetical protein NC652_003175 [Populus alba x Populus x berolinensis]